MVVIAGLGVAGAEAQPTVLYTTGFEKAQGFNLDLPLVNQPGWTGAGADGRLQTNGNGIVTNFFGGQGQHAYVGFDLLSGTNDTLNVWHPLNFDPIGTGKPVVKLTVTMAIFDSTGDIFDCFRWSVYNNANGGTRLFTLDFDNSTLAISYLLDDTNGFVSTGYTFEPADLDENIGIYDLEVTMNFASNRWSAALVGQNPVVIVNSRPITTKGSALTLGDIDAVWVYGLSTNAPGDNFMVFDNYKVTAEASAPLPFQLQSVSHLSNGAFLLQLSGEPGRSYAVEATTDFTDWSALKTNTAGPDGTLDFLDTTATSFSHSFYRARLVQ